MNSKILLLVLFTIFAWPKLYAQNCPCISNSGIDGSNVGRGNPVNSSIASWWVLSGTPILAEGMVGSDGFKLTNGDGMATCYSFYTGMKYKVCFRAYTTNNANGTVTLETNGSTIGNVTVSQHGLPPKDYSITFTASANFNQLRFLVNTAGTSVVIDDVGVIEVPTLTASPSTIYTCGSTTLSASSHNPLTVTWQPWGTVNPTSGTSVTASPCKTTTYTATYNTSCSMFTCKADVATVTVTVQPNGEILDNSSTICGEYIDLQYNPYVSCTVTSYTWYSPTNNIISSGPSFYKNFSAKGDWGLYKLKVIYANGCEDSFYTAVNQNCCVTLADFDIVGCNPVRFENHTVDGDGNPVIQGEWFWDLGEGTTSTLRSPAHWNVMDLSHRKVCLTAVVADAFSTCCDRVCKEFDPCDGGCDPKAAFDFRIINPVNRDIQLFDKSAGNGTAVQWVWTVDGNPIMGNLDPNPVVLGLSSGLHTICLDVEFLQWSGTQSCFEYGWCEEIFIP